MIIFLVAVSAYFSAAETALTSLKRTKLKNIENENANLAERLKTWMKRPNEILTTMLIGKSFASVLSVIIAAILTLKTFKGTIFAENYFLIGAISTFIMSIVLLVFGEIIPKIIARNNCENISKQVIGTLYMLSVVFTPVVMIISSLSLLFTNMMGIKIKKDGYLITENDIKNLVDVGEEVGAIEADEKNMIHSIFAFGDVNVSEVMVPRTRIYAIDGSLKIGDVWRGIVRNGYSRMPVFDETIDNIIGMVYLKDIIPYVGKKEFFRIPIKNIIRHAYFIPATKNGTDLLREFREKKVHMAVVIDEYGGTLGIVTIEDLIEEIVGDINDEYDIEEKLVVPLDNGSYDVDPLITINELNEKIGLEIPESEEYDTLSGFIYSNLGKMPSVGDKVVEGKINFTITGVDKNRIIAICISIEE